MGKGDIKSRKGKLANGSFGKRRLRNETKKKVEAVDSTLVAEKQKSTSKEKSAKNKA